MFQFKRPLKLYLLWLKQSFLSNKMEMKYLQIFLGSRLIVAMGSFIFIAQELNESRIENNT